MTKPAPCKRINLNRGDNMPCRRRYLESDQGIKEREPYIREFGVPQPDRMGKYDLWPGYAATFI